MRCLIFSVLVVCFSTAAPAHHPDHENHPVHQRIDVIGPLGTRLPMSYRRKYNRPSKWGGRIAYYIAPSSQEAMAWHAATHRGDYKNHRPRIETHYFYPKPWEALRIGPRIDSDENSVDENSVDGDPTLPPGQTYLRGAPEPTLAPEPTPATESMQEPEPLQDLMQLPRDQPIANEIDLIE